MKSVKVFAIAVFALFLGFSLLPISASAGKVKEPQPVIVENSSVPVTIGNTSVPVTIQNTPITIESVPPQPFQWKGNLDCVKGSAHAGFTVPTGKRLIIEYVSGNGNFHCSPDGTTGIIYELSVATVAGGESAKHYLAGNPQGESAQCLVRFLTVNQNMRVYADPETQVDVFMQVDRSGYLYVTLSGYLVDVK